MWAGDFPAAEPQLLITSVSGVPTAKCVAWVYEQEIIGEGDIYIQDTDDRSWLVRSRRHLDGGVVLIFWLQDRKVEGPAW